MAKVTGAPGLSEKSQEPSWGHGIVGKVLALQALGPELFPPRTQIKSQARYCMLIIPSAEEEDRMIPGVCWPQSLHKC